MRQPYNVPCKKCGSTNQTLMISDSRKSIFCSNCNNFEDLYASDDLKQQWESEANEKEQAEINAKMQATVNIPKCPTCQSANIKKISVTSKVTNIALFGLLGTKRYKTFHCNNCGYEW